jgi:hypothetical protein
MNITHEEIEEKMKLCTGARITNPEKFEGELDYVPFMWHVAMSGFCEDIGNSFFVTLDAIGHRHFDLYGAELWEDSNGFVHSNWFATLEEFSSAVRTAENQEMLLAEDSDDY